MDRKLRNRIVIFLLLAGVVCNLTAGAGVLTIQYYADENRGLQILRWLIGSLDAVGFETTNQMLLFLVPVGSP